MANKGILILDDEVDICYLLGGILKKQGFKVQYAHTITEGVAKLSDVEPVFLFLDINLPDGSGLEMLADIRLKFPLLKIIIITAFDSDEEQSQARKYGADYFISKPFDQAMIIKAIKSVMPEIS